MIFCICFMVILVIFKIYVSYGSVATGLKFGEIFNKYLTANYPQTEGHDKPQNLDNVAAVSRGIWQNFPRKTVGPIHHRITLNKYLAGNSTASLQHNQFGQ